MMNSELLYFLKSITSEKNNKKLAHAFHPLFFWGPSVLTILIVGWFPFQTWVVPSRQNMWVSTDRVLSKRGHWWFPSFLLNAFHKMKKIKIKEIKKIKKIRQFSKFLCNCMSSSWTKMHDLHYMYEIPSFQTSTTTQESVQQLMSFLEQEWKRNPIQWNRWLNHSFFPLVCFDMWYRWILHPYRIWNTFEPYQTIHLPDGEMIAYAWTKCEFQKPIRYVVILHHSLCGDLYEHVDFARECQKQHVLVFSFSRRGHYPRPFLTKPIFHTMGSREDFEFLLETLVLPRCQTINTKCSKLEKIPLFAFASSAGTGVVADYLATHGSQSALDGAFFVSSGYGIEDTFRHISSPLQTFFIKRLNQHFIQPNLSILRQKSSFHVRQLLQASNLLEWHDVQSCFSHIKNWRDRDPKPRRHQIEKPLICLHALNDPIFPYLSNEMQNVCQEWLECPWVGHIVTNQGYHVYFREDLYRLPVMYRLAMSTFDCLWMQHLFS